jgi:hypothetical protein
MAGDSTVPQHGGIGAIQLFHIKSSLQQKHHINFLPPLDSSETMQALLLQPVRLVGPLLLVKALLHQPERLVGALLLVKALPPQP